MTLIRGCNLHRLSQTRNDKTGFCYENHVFPKLVNKQEMTNHGFGDRFFCSPPMRFDGLIVTTVGMAAIFLLTLSHTHILRGHRGHLRFEAPQAHSMLITSTESHGCSISVCKAISFRGSKARGVSLQINDRVVFS